MHYLLILYFAAAPSIGLVFPPATHLTSYYQCEKVGSKIVGFTHDKNFGGMSLEVKQFKCAETR